MIKRYYVDWWVRMGIAGNTLPDGYFIVYYADEKWARKDVNFDYHLIKI
jgi:hypothetical protein